MKETGVVRRIDELGRIVIPKEIRKRLRVGSGDLLDIYTNDREIILAKYSPMTDIETSLKTLVKAIKEETKSDIIVTDKTKILVSTFDMLKENDEITDGFIKTINGKEEIELLKTTNINVTNDFQNNKSLYAKRIVDNGDYVGCIIVLNDGIISKADRDLASILKRYVLLNIVIEI